MQRAVRETAFLRFEFTCWVARESASVVGGGLGDCLLVFGDWVQVSDDWMQGLGLPHQVLSYIG